LKLIANGYVTKTDKNIELLVSCYESGVRIDVFLTHRFKELSRTLIQRLITKKSVRLNGCYPQRSDLVRTDDIVLIDKMTADNKQTLAPTPMTLDIIYEDDDLIVINKPANLIVHPGAGTSGTPTLVEGVLYHTKSLSLLDNEVAKFRPGIVHRLDKDTTGLLVMAKTNFSHQKLAKQFAEKTNKRVYLALLDGILKTSSLRIETILQREKKMKTRFSSIPIREQEDSPRGKRAISEFEKIVTFSNHLTLAKIRLSTGRTHQIRVQAKSTKCPVLGDLVYHRPVQLPYTFPREIRNYFEKITRQQLHAWELGFTHPRDNRFISFTAPLPELFKKNLLLLEPYADETGWQKKLIRQNND